MKSFNNHKQTFNDIIICMYIPYFEIAKSIASVLPETIKKRIVNFGYELKIKQNLNYIHKNRKRVLKAIHGKKHLNIAFYVYDDAKWKSQSVYKLLDKEKNFTPYIFVTKNAAPKENFNYQSVDDVKKVYKFFAEKNMRVKYAYDTDNEKYIPFEKMTPKPDIIIYQHPWYVETSQGPVVCSKFALTCYIPYFISDTEEEFEYNLRFHKYIYRHYIPNQIIKNNYTAKMTCNSESLVVAGHPQLDYFYKNTTANKYNPNYTIYAPHWSVCGENIRYSTFDWNGYEILNFAKQHPELNWIFKPHPNLYNFFIKSDYMTKENLDKYFEEWREIGSVCLDGNYMELFLQSNAMITDSGSFLNEYFLTERPLIHLVSKAFKGNESVKTICSTYYEVHDLNEMYKYFDEILLKRNDYKKQDRINLIKTLNYTNSAQAILNDLLKICDKISL